MTDRHLNNMVFCECFKMIITNGVPAWCGICNRPITQQTQPDNLTIGQLEKLAKSCEGSPLANIIFGGEIVPMNLGSLSRQLLDTMHENERLRKMLQECFEEVTLLAKDPDTNWLVQKIKGILYPSKHSLTSSTIVTPSTGKSTNPQVVTVYDEDGTERQVTIQPSKTSGNE